MALAEKRIEAKQRYISTAMTCTAIARELAIDPKTVYRWKTEDMEKGETFDWDFQRELYHISIDQVASKYRKAIAIMVDKIDKDPDLLTNSKTADAFAKIFKAFDRIDIRGQYLRVITELIRIANRWLAENQPELKERMEPWWESIYQELAKYSTGKGLFE
jgi:hypothetical protein